MKGAKKNYDVYRVGKYTFQYDTKHNVHVLSAKLKFQIQSICFSKQVLRIKYLLKYISISEILSQNESNLTKSGKIYDNKIFMKTKAQRMKLTVTVTQFG